MHASEREKIKNEKDKKRIVNDGNSTDFER